jgi:hypothetical protein
MKSMKGMKEPGHGPGVLLQLFLLFMLFVVVRTQPPDARIVPGAQM